MRRKTLFTGTGETISYKTLIIATGARVLNLFVLLFQPLALVSINSSLHFLSFIGKKKQADVACDDQVALNS